MRAPALTLTDFDYNLKDVVRRIQWCLIQVPVWKGGNKTYAEYKTHETFMSYYTKSLMIGNGGSKNKFIGLFN